MRFTNPNFVIRLGSLVKEEYLQRDGSFGNYRTARRFKNIDLADRAAIGRLGDMGDYGIFPVSTRRRIRKTA